MLSRASTCGARALLLAIVLPFGQAWSGDRTPEPCDTSNRNKTIRIDLPAGDDAPPRPNHRVVCFKGGSEAQFDLPDKIRGTLYVVFLDRTPLLDRGEPLYVIKGKDAAREKFDLVAYDAANPANNVYYYLLVDIKKEHRPTLDPLIVIEPN